MVSLVLRPALEPSDAGLLTAAGGPGVGRSDVAPERSAGAVQVAERSPARRRKAGGILSRVGARLDGGLRHVVIGSGINLVAPPGVAEAAGLGRRR